MTWFSAIIYAAMILIGAAALGVVVEEITGVYNAKINGALAILWAIHVIINVT